MAKKKNTEDISGSTFADLYDVQQEFIRKDTKPIGRPKNKVKRKPTTVYLTRNEYNTLRRLHLTIGDHIASVSRSEIIGLAVELISEVVATNDHEGSLFAGVRSFEGLKQRVLDSIDN